MTGLTILKVQSCIGWSKSINGHKNKKMQEEKISLLDKSSWDKSEILDRMTNDDFYYGYLGKNCLSSSSIKKILHSPLAYQQSFEPIDEKSRTNLDVGWLFHLAILEPEIYANQIVVDVKSRDTVKFKNAYEKNMGKSTRVFTKSEVELVQGMGMSFHNNSKAKSLLEGTKKEVPGIDVLFGIPFRAKADALGPDYIVDLKTTSNIDRFYWEAKTWRYDIQCFIYCEIFGISKDNFTFIAIDKRDNRVGMYKVSDKSYENAKYDCKDAVKRFKKYFIEKEEEIYDFTLEGFI